jgi:hypothetical protein
MAWYDELNQGTYGQQSSRPGSVQALRAQMSAGNQQTQPQAKAPQKGFFADQISTAGGIGGALAGAAGGAAIGSAFTPVGTVIGGLIGSVIGGAGGSAAGEVTENVISGDRLGKNVGQEALFGGLTSLPIGAGFKLARAGGKALTGLGKTSASNLVQEAGIQTIGKGTVGRLARSGKLDKNATDAFNRLSVKSTAKAGAKAETLGAKLIASQSNITAAQARNANINPNKVFGSIAKRTGLSSLDDMAEIGRGLTGAGDNSLLDTLTREAVSNTTGVAVPDIRKLANSLMDDGASLLTDAQRKTVQNNMKNASLSMFGGSRGSLSTLANPTASLSQANAFRAVASDITSSFNVAPAEKQLAKIYNGVADQIEKAIYNSPGVNDIVPLLTKAGSDDLLFRAQSLRASGNGAQATAYERIAKELSNAKSVSAIRTMKRDFVQIGKIDKLSAQADGARSIGGKNQTNSAGSLIRNPLNLIGAPLDAASPRIGSGLSQLGRAAQSGIARPGQGLVGLGVRQSLASPINEQQAAQGLDQGGSEQTQPLTLAQQLTGEIGQSGQAGQFGNVDQAQQTQSQNPYPQANLLYDLQRDPANAKDYIAQYQTLQEIFAPQTTGSDLTSVQATRATAAQNALLDIPLIEDAINTGQLGVKKAIPGASTAVGRAVLGTENLDAALFNIADNILRARSGAAAPEAEVARFVATFLPGPLDSTEAKNFKLQRAVRELQGYVNPASSSSNSLEDTLIQAQQGGF